MRTGSGHEIPGRFALEEKGFLLREIWLESCDFLSFVMRVVCF